MLDVLPIVRHETSTSPPLTGLPLLPPDLRQGEPEGREGEGKKEPDLLSTFGAV